MTKQLCDSSVIANNARKTQKLFVQGYNLEVHGVIKYTPGFCVTNKQKPLQAIVTFGEIRTLLKEYRRTRKGRRIKGIAMAQWVNRLRNNIFVNPPPLPLSCEISGVLHLAQPGLMAGWLAVRPSVRPAGRRNTGEFRNFQS